VLLLRSSAAGFRNERDMICDKFLLRCEDERIGILSFGSGCCGLDTRTQRGRSYWALEVAVVAVEVASEGTIEGAASMMTVLVVVDVRPDCSVAT
jgi:hypothetical protein